MIFQERLAAKVLSGDKTVTRRPAVDNARSPWFAGECSYRPTRRYSVQTGRGKPSIGMIVVTDVRLGTLGQITIADALLEGFDSLEAFKATWVGLHDEWNLETKVWRVEFEVVR